MILKYLSIGLRMVRMRFPLVSGQKPVRALADSIERALSQRLVVVIIPHYR